MPPMVLLLSSVTREPFITVVRTGSKLSRVAAPRADERVAKVVAAHRDATLKVIQSKENSVLATPVSFRADILNLQFLRIALRKIAIWGLGGSLVVHLVLAALSAIVIGQRAVVVIVSPAVEEEPDVTMVLPKPLAEATYIRSTEPEPQDASPEKQPQEVAAPAKPDFFSDKNSVAMSKDAPDPGGDPTLPSLKGTEASARDLVESAYRDDNAKYSALPSLSPPPEPTISQPQSAPPPQAMTEDAIKAEPEKPVVEVPPSTTPNQQAAQSSSAAQTEARSQGGITQRGDHNAVNAARTMAGEYYRDAQDAITRRWNKEMEIANVHMLPGTVVLRVLVEKNGNVRPSDISVVSGPAGQIIAQTAYKAILRTKLPPLPAEMDPVLEDGKYEFRMNFILR